MRDAARRTAKKAPILRIKPLSPADLSAIDGEAIRRRIAKEGLCGYASIIDVPGRPVGGVDDGAAGGAADVLYESVESSLATHHKLILNACHAMTQRRYGRVMLFMPPGSAKSTYASVVFPSWYLGQHPGTKIGLASYGDDLVRKMGRRTRAVIRQARYQQVFPGITLSRDSQAAQEFTLTNGSEYMASGLFTGITGNRFHGAIIDDPVKGREQANSEIVRQKTWDIYVDDILTRLVPGGWILLIQTRWHEDDLSGRILPDGWDGQSGDILCKDGRVWTVLCLQAECERADDPLHREVGEMLWPEWFDEEHWAPFRAVPRTWASLFQQRPSPQEGDLFKVDQIEIIDALPAEHMQWVRGWDLAATESDGAWTVGVRMGRTRGGRIIVHSVTRAQRGPGRRDTMLVNTAKMDGPEVRQSIPQDPGQAGKMQVLDLMRKITQGARVTPHFSPESGDKVQRATPFADQVSIGNVAMVRGSWNAAYVEELRTFPNGRYTDQVDASSRAYELLIGRADMVISDAVIQGIEARESNLSDDLGISDDALEDI